MKKANPKNGRKQIAFAPRASTQNDARQSISKTGRHQRTKRLTSGIIIVAVAGLVAIMTGLHSNEELTVQIDAKTPPIETPKTVTLEGISYQGISDDGKEFAVAAETATESADTAQQIHLGFVSATIETATKNPITVKADSGEFIRDNKTVWLRGNVVIARPDLDYTLMTEEAFADLGNGLMKSQTQVHAFSADADIRSDGMVVDDNNIIFTGNVVLVLDQQARQER